MRWSGFCPGSCVSSWSCAKATRVAVTAVIGPVGPEHWIRVPPISDVIKAITAAESIPANAPRPDKSPNAAPRLNATKLTVNAATTFCIIFCVRELG